MPVDTVIRGGLVVDGTGETKARIADVAIKDGLIVAVGPELSEKGADEIDASGLLVTPGWCAPLPARRAPWPAAAALSAALAVGRSRCRRQRCGRSRLAANAADADSWLMEPCRVDCHTHYDAQVGWDPTLSPSCWHGVTSVVFGNCGVTLCVPPFRCGPDLTDQRSDECSSCVFAARRAGRTTTTS